MPETPPHAHGAGGAESCYARGTVVPTLSRKPSLIFVCVTMFLDALGIGLMIPVGPKLIALVQGLPTEGAEHATSSSFGLLMATYAAMQFLFAPLMGSLSDRFGRRPVLLCALFGSGVDYFIGAMAPNLWVLFITRALNGVSGATMPVCSAYVADVTPPAKRAAGFGALFAAFGMGFVFGPLLGGFLGDTTQQLPLIGAGDIRYPYIAAGTLTLLNWAYGLVMVPESLPREQRRPFSRAKANPFGALKWLATKPVALTLAIAFLLMNMAQFGLHSTWVLSMQARFGWTPRHVGWSMAVVGISAAIVQGGLARKVIPALGERVCLVVGVGIGVLAFIAYGTATQGWMIYAIIAIASLGGVAGPAAQAITSKTAVGNEQGLLQGALGSLSSVAGVLGPLTATEVFRLFTKADGASKGLLGAGSPFLSGALLMMLSLVPVAMVWRRLPREVGEKPVESGK